MPITSSWLNTVSAVAETMLKSPTLLLYRIPSPATHFVSHILKLLLGTYTLLLLNASLFLVLTFPKTYFDINIVLLLSYDCF